MIFFNVCHNENLETVYQYLQNKRITFVKIDPGIYMYRSFHARKNYQFKIDTAYFIMLHKFLSKNDIIYSSNILNLIPDLIIEQKFNLISYLYNKKNT